MYVYIWKRHKRELHTTGIAYSSYPVGPKWNIQHQTAGGTRTVRWRFTIQPRPRRFRQAHKLTCRQSCDTDSGPRVGLTEYTNEFPVAGRAGTFKTRFVFPLPFVWLWKRKNVMRSQTICSDDGAKTINRRTTIAGSSSHMRRMFRLTPPHPRIVYGLGKP